MPETTNAAATTCPVCGWDATETGQDVHVGESTVRVCSDECARAVALAPTKYLAAPKG